MVIVLQEQMPRLIASSSKLAVAVENADREGQYINILDAKA